jgi:S1-C subfamily serine protease
VRDVWPGSGAAAAGILPTRRAGVGRYALGDLIVAIDGKPVTEKKMVTDVVSQKKLGDSVVLTVIRSGNRKEVPVTLRPRPATPDE